MTTKMTPGTVITEKNGKDFACFMTSFKVGCWRIGRERDGVGEGLMILMKGR